MKKFNIIGLLVSVSILVILLVLCFKTSPKQRNIPLQTQTELTSKLTLNDLNRLFRNDGFGCRYESYDKTYSLLREISQANGIQFAKPDFKYSEQIQFSNHYNDITVLYNLDSDGFITNLTLLCTVVRYRIPN